ncbi:hypothetical protein D0869_11004, partial [Hortaea werneckii]
MSVNIDWQTLTEGPDGEALAETIRAFVHERFQQISLPKLIRSVKCHSFDFGTIAPNVVLKDICNPLPDFYEDDTESEGSALEKDSSPPAKVTETGQPEGQEQHPLHQHHHAESFSSISPPPSNTPPSRAESGDHSSNQQRHASTISAGSDTPVHDDRSPEDLQVVYHVTYSGNVRLSMTTE